MMRFIGIVGLVFFWAAFFFLLGAASGRRVWGWIEDLVGCNGPTAKRKAQWWNPRRGTKAMTRTLLILLLIALQAQAQRSPFSDPARVAAMTRRATSADPLLSGLVGWWKMDEGSGTTTADAAGTNTGTLSGAAIPTWTTGHSGGALAFNGTNSYVDCGSGSSLQLTNKGTVSAWVNLTNIGSSAIILGTGNWTTDRNGFLLVCIASNNLPTILLSIADSNGNTYVQGASFTLQTWHHVVGQWDGVNLKTYVDGVEAGQTAQNRNAQGGINRFLIGKDVSSSSYIPNGTLDDVRVWNRALTTNEIAQLYAQ